MIDALEAGPLPPYEELFASGQGFTDEGFQCCRLGARLLGESRRLAV
jgi:hypothetical protein